MREVTECLIWRVSCDTFATCTRYSEKRKSHVCVHRSNQKKNSDYDLVFNQDNLLKFLPFDPVESQRFHEGLVDGYFFRFGSALDTSVSKGKFSTIIKQGYHKPGIDDRLEQHLLKGGPVESQVFPESFCAILIQPTKITSYSSSTGVDQLFFYSTESATYVTNRHNLLGAVQNGLTFKKSSFEWMVGRTHIGDMSTYWNEITRSKPGQKHTITSYFTSVDNPQAGNLFDPIDIGDIKSEISDISGYFQDILAGVPGEKRLWLSGGKDSRAIYGLIECPEVRSDLKLTTSGEYFAPDVMAAQGISALTGMADKHSITRPAITSSKMVVAEKVAGDLTIDFTGGSLADLRPVSRSNVCIMGGHENGFKSKRNTKNLEEYLNERIYWVDNLNILKKDVRDRIFSEHKESLIATLENVPLSRYGQVDLVNNRNPNFLSSTITTSHISASEIHPFLDGRMYRLLCGVSDEALESQLIHYAMMHNSDYALESLPFAADNWPASLYDIAKKLGIPPRNGRSQPFKFNSLFPTLKSFGLYDWRLNLVDASQGFVKNYVSSNKDFFDFLDEETFNKLVTKSSKEFLFKEIYTFLAILKACFVHHFKERILDFSKRKEIAEEVSRLLDSNRLSGKPDPTRESYLEQESAFLKAKLEDYEKSIAAIVGQNKIDMESGVGSGSVGEDVILDSMSKHAFSGEGSEIVDSIVSALGYKKVPSGGVLVSSQKFSGKDKCDVSIELFLDSSEANKILVSFYSDSEIKPEGFSYSSAGFYFKYISLPKNHGKSITNLSFIGSAEEFDAQVMIKPWYSSKPIYYKSIELKVV